MPKHSLAPSQPPQTPQSSRAPWGGQSHLQRSLTPSGQPRTSPPMVPPAGLGQGGGSGSLGPLGSSWVQPPPPSSPQHQGTHQGRGVSTSSSPTGQQHRDALMGSPRLQKGALWAGIVTAFNPTRVDTSFKTIPFCLFSGDFLHIPVGKEEHFREVQFLSVFFFFIFSIGTLKHGECASQCFVCLKFFPGAYLQLQYLFVSDRKKRRLFELGIHDPKSRKADLQYLYIYTYIYICFCVYTDTFLSSLKY